jgi:hypothetical protein
MEVPMKDNSVGQTKTSPTVRLRWIRLFLCSGALVAVAALTASAQQSNIPQNPTINPAKPIILPEANRPPDANAQMEMREQQTKQQDFAAANAERRKQIADDSARLLKMAADLKAEVDKTTKDTLSLSVIRKADDIERLAHSVKEKMKLTMGAN